MKRQLKYKVFILILIAIVSALHYYVDQGEPVHGFYRLLYFIPIILASFNFGFKGGIVTSIIVSLIYSPYMLLSIDFGSKTMVNELLDIVLFFTVGIITGTLIEKKNLSLLKLDNELKRYSLLENYMKSIIESIKDGIIAVNNDMLITTINQGAKEILKVESDCSGQNIFEVLPCCQDIIVKIQDSLENNKVIENIEETFKQGDIELVLSISLFPLNYEGVNKGLVIIIEDITEFKIMQGQILRNDRLAALGELSTGIAHEIRNPLAIIKAIGQTLKKELKESEITNELDIIDEEVERANRVIKALMEFGKPSKNEKVEASLNDVIEEVLIITSKYISGHGVDVRFDKGAISATMLDKEQVKQAFINIIFNAVEAMPNGGNLAVSSKVQDNKWVRVAFADTGTGIEEKDMSKIFNPFFTTKTQGTGLGLALVSRIAEEHSGIINVSSKTGEGTTFEILFPM